MSPASRRWLAPLLYGGEHAYLLDDYVSAMRRAGYRVKRVVTPLQSAVNFHPETEASIKDAIVMRLPRPARFLKLVLRFPGAWPSLRAVLSKFDHRPGRLYSFVCERPAA